MFQQSILDALSNIGFGQMGWSDISGLSPGQISTTFQQHYELEESDIPSGMFQSITPEMLQGASYSTYAPQIQAKGPSMLSELQKGLGGQAATKALGGFAGSGGFGQQQAGVKDVYGKGMTDILTGIGASRSDASTNIADLMSSWQKTAQDIRYG